MAHNDKSEKAKPTREELLADPALGTVDDIVALFESITPDEVNAVKDLEETGKARIGILDWEPPVTESLAPAGDTAPGDDVPPFDPPPSTEPTFTRERLLGRDGERITGQSHAVIAGALHGDTTATFTAPEINTKIVEFLAHEDTTGQEA